MPRHTIYDHRPDDLSWPAISPEVVTIGVFMLDARQSLVSKWEKARFGIFLLVLVQVLSCDCSTDAPDCSEASQHDELVVVREEANSWGLTISSHQPYDVTVKVYHLANHMDTQADYSERLSFWKKYPKHEGFGNVNDLSRADSLEYVGAGSYGNWRDVIIYPVLTEKPSRVFCIAEAQQQDSQFLITLEAEPEFPGDAYIAPAYCTKLILDILQNLPPKEILQFPDISIPLSSKNQISHEIAEFMDGDVFLRQD
jgi:hypothetical protein